MIHRNKRGYFWDLAIPFITLLFCILVVISYNLSVGNVRDSVASPVPLLESSDNLLLFEQEEFELLLNTYCADSSIDSLESRYCSSFYSLNSINVILQDTQPLSSSITSDTLCENIYSFESKSGNIRVTRSGLVKKVSLPVSSDAAVRFPMRADIILNQQYLLSSVDCV